MNSIEKINWFPGHMKKSIDLLRKKIKSIDLIIHVVDSRAINITSNNDIFKTIGYNKEILKVALKSDLASEQIKDENIILCNIHNNKFRKDIINRIYSILSNKIQSYKKKGLINPKFYIAVVGLPNVGKSSLINFLAQKKQLKVQNLPGLTKKQEWIQIDKNLFLLDTPGVLFKNINKIEDGYILTLLKCIKWNITPKNKVIEFGFNFFSSKYTEEFWKYFDTQPIENYENFLIYVCKKYCLFMKNNEFDFDLCIEKLYNIFSSNFIKKINFE